MQLIKTLFALALITTFTACGNNAQKKPELPKLEKTEKPSEVMQSIRMIHWDLTDFTYQNKETAAIASEKKKPYLILRDGKASGFAGCNNFIGKYEEGKDGTIRFIGVQAPRQTCKDYALQEMYYLDLLNNATAYEVSEDGKLMKIKSLKGELRFKRQ